MLISYLNEFIFIHTYKTAGTSIHHALRRYAFPNPFKRYVNIVTRRLANRLDLDIPDPFYKDRIFPTHIKAREIKSQLPPEVFDNFFKFAFVRNPWDWQVSLYFYMQQSPSHFQYDIVAPMTFDEYIEWRVTEDRWFQKDFVVDENGRLLVDFVGKYEQLNQDFQQVCDTLGLDAALPHKQKSSHRDYRTYYNERTKHLVEEYFKEDIEFFGYTFDTGIH
jgi:hypothetical protein